MYVHVLVNFTLHVDASVPHACILDMRDLSADLKEVVLAEYRVQAPKASGAYLNEVARLDCRLMVSEQKRVALCRENEELKEELAKLNMPIRPIKTINLRYTISDDNTTALNRQISALDQELIAKEKQVESIRVSHEAQLKRLEELNREEVQSLRTALSSSLSSVDKWKVMYSDDITHAGKDMMDLHDRPFSSTLEKSKSFGKL